MTTPGVFTWFAVRVAPQAEQRAYRGLLEQRMDAYLPLETRWRHGRRTKTRVDRPLFAGYVFVGLSADNPEFYRVASTDGVTGFIGVGGKPFPVRFGKVKKDPGAFSIEGMREAQTLGLFDTTRSKKITFAPGQPVRVIGGPFTGFMAQVLETPSDDAKRIRILMQAIGRGNSQPTTIALAQLEAA